MDKAKASPSEFNKKLPLMRTPARASLWYCTASLICRGISFILTPIFTRILSGDEYGILPLYTSWMSVISAILTIELAGSVLYRGFTKFDSRDFSKSAMATLVAVFGALCLPFFLLSGKLSRLFGLSPSLLAVMAIHSLLDAICALFCTRERYFYGYRRVFFINVIPALASPPIALALIPTFGGAARPYAACLASLAIASVLGTLLLREGGRVRWDIVKYVLRSGVSMLPFAASSILLANADKLMVANKFGSAALAKYSVAHSLGLLLTFVSVGLYGALKPWIIRKLAAGEEKSVAKTVNSLLSLFCILTAALCCAVPELLAFLAPAEYSGVIGEVYILALSVLPMFLVNVFSSVLMFLEKSWIFSLSTLGAAFLNIGLNTLLLAEFSYGAAAFSHLLSYCLLALALRLALKSDGLVGGGGLLRLGACTLAVIIIRRFEANIAVRIVFLAAMLPLLATSLWRLFSLVREKERVGA